eukprot:275605_1
MDALSMHETIHSIKTMNRYQLLSYLNRFISRDIDSMKNILILAIVKMNSIAETWDDSEVDNWLRYYIPKHDILNITTPPSKLKDAMVEVHQSSDLLTTLPPTLTSYIISYCTMYERVKMKSICKEFYDCCRPSMSKSHLMIDKTFVKAIANKTMQYDEYFNAHLNTIDVAYVFADSKWSKYPQFESTYYRAIARIIHKAHAIKRIRYNLKYGHFVSSFNDKYLNNGVPWGNVFRSSVLSWATNVFAASVDFRPFHSVQELKIIDREFWSLSFNVEEFHRLFPNINSLIIDRPTHSTAHQHQFWALFSLKFYASKLQHLDIDLTAVLGPAVNNDNYPLWSLPRFKSLKTLKIKMWIKPDETEYYQQMMQKHGITNVTSLRCTSLESLDLSFKTGRTMVVLDTIHALCQYLLDMAPNVTSFTLNQRQMMFQVISLKYLIGRSDRLKSLHMTNMESLNFNLRMLSLKQLRVTQHSGNTFGVAVHKSPNFTFQSFPRLESFYFKNENTQINQVNHEIIEFLQYLLEHKSMLNHLQHVSFICMDNIRQMKTNKEKNFKTRTKKMKGDMSCDYKTSEKICKLIVDLSSYIPNITLIEIRPVILHKKHYQYLDFWCNGKCEKEIFATKRNSFACMDMVLYSANPPIATK